MTKFPALQSLLAHWEGTEIMRNQLVYKSQAKKFFVEPFPYGSDFVDTGLHCDNSPAMHVLCEVLNVAIAEEHRLMVACTMELIHQENIVKNLSD
jgi:hypothetical protein